MPKGHPTLALAIRPMFLTIYADWIEFAAPCACHAVLVPEYGPIVSAATPEPVVCLK